jgi:hypothetical protein
MNADKRDDLTRDKVIWSSLILGNKKVDVLGICSALPHHSTGQMASQWMAANPSFVLDKDLH